MITKLFCKLYIPFAFLFLNSCLSLFSNHKQEINFKSNISIVKVTLIEKGQIVDRFTIPAIVDVRRSTGIILVLSAPGYHTVSRVIHSHPSSRMCLSGSLSLLTLGIGFIVDGYYSEFYSYPDEFYIKMYPLNEEFAIMNIKVTTKDRLSGSMNNYYLGIN